jgi:hypothetical protein
MPFLILRVEGLAEPTACFLRSERQSECCRVVACPDYLGTAYCFNTIVFKA